VEGTEKEKTGKAGKEVVDYTADLFLHDRTRRTDGRGGAPDVPVELVGLDRIRRPSRLANLW
jgi:hypothetical protein